MSGGYVGGRAASQVVVSSGFTAQSERRKWLYGNLGFLGLQPFVESFILPAMPIRVTIGGAVFECDTAVEAREIAGITGNSCDLGLVEPKRRPGRPRGSRNGKSPIDALESGKRAKTIALLRAIGKAGKRGINSEAVATAMELGGTQGVGGALRTVGRHLSEIGSHSADVIKMGGEPGHRLWRGGASLPQALERLEGG